MPGGSAALPGNRSGILMDGTFGESILPGAVIANGLPPQIRNRKRVDTERVRDSGARTPRIRVVLCESERRRTCIMADSASLARRICRRSHQGLYQAP